MAQEPSAAVDVPTRWPLVVEPDNRDGTTAKDAQLVNCYVELRKLETGTEYNVYKRPGLLEQSRPPAGNAAGAGLFNWRGDIYSVFGATVYKNGVALAGAVDATGGVYHWASCLGATPRLELGNGVEAYYYDAGGGLVLIADPDFPVTFVKGWGYLDGTIYVMKANAHIQGSDFNDPAAWDPLNDILAQIEADEGVALAKQLVYIIAFKQWSTEVFYDAGNAAGSPLGAVQGAKMSFGLVSAGSLQDFDGVLMGVVTSRTAGTQVVMIESLKAVMVSNEPIERLLQTADWTTTFSWQLSMQGHRFYVVTSKVSNLTLAYDLDQRRWHRWTDSAGNYMPIVASTFDSSRRAILQHETNGRLYYASPTYVNDDGVKIVVDIITPNWDGGVESRTKTLYRLFAVGDRTPGSELEVRCSDDDYRSWSNPRMMDLSQSRPVLNDCGTFDRRAYWLRHQSNTTLRIQALELQMDLGQG